MKQFINLLLFSFSLFIAFDFLTENYLDARPGGGSSYRSSSSSSSRSSSSSFSRSSSSSSSSSFGSHSSGGGSMSAGDGATIGAVFLGIISLFLFMVGFPENPLTLKSWGKINIIMFLLSLGVIALTSLLVFKSSVVMFVFVAAFALGPFILVYSIFKVLFGSRNQIYVSKGKK
jgi:hypothetical protein